MKKKTILSCVQIATGVIAAGSLSAFCWLHGVVRAYERAHGVKIVSCESGVRPVASQDGALADPAGSNAVKTAAKTAATDASNEAERPTAVLPPQLKITGVERGGSGRLVVKFSERPDFAVARSFVSVSPLRAGAICIRPETDLWGETGNMVVCGDFAFRTNVTLRVRKGLPLAPTNGVAIADGALKDDFIYTFTRRDQPPSVDFVDDGRYLPACGARAITIESVNVPSVQMEVRRVEPANVVQLLAREEGAYACYWGDGNVDCERTAELAGEPSVVRRACRHRKNEEEKVAVPVSASDGGPDTGIYLLAIGDGSKPFDERHEIRGAEGRWIDNPNRNPRMAYRLACVSDLGVSVRRNETGLGVWVASLTSGRPVWNAQVDVYSKSNVKVFSGRTGAKGWCAPKRVAAGEPFAVVVSSADGSDRTFLALSDRNKVDESLPDGGRPAFLKPGECSGFAWTERGIYRHGEKIFFQLILRDDAMRAPKPFPVALELRDPKGVAFAVKTVLPDALGAVSCETFSVPDDQPSGNWSIVAKLSGKDGAELGAASVKIEEFAPPQIRVTVAPCADAAATNFAFAVSAEHLFGGPARALVCKGAVVFEDVPFAPEAWKEYSFGNDMLGLKPNFERLPERILDENGKTSFAAGMPAELGKPKAMVRATGQGVVLEDGGRPATARKTVFVHHYPYYVGSKLARWLRAPDSGFPKIAFACVLPDGKRAPDAKTLSVKLVRVDSVFAYRETSRGWHTWESELVRDVVVENAEFVATPGRDAEWTMPVREPGDYEITVTDPATGVSYGKAFYLSGRDDAAIRAPLAKPTAVTLHPDKPVYRVGESPRLVVKSPFTGHALLSVMRERELYTEILELTNATSEIALRPVTRADAPNLDVYVSVVQSVEASAKRLAARAHGQVTVGVRPLESELDVHLDAAVALRPEGGGAEVTVEVVASGACVSGAVATVTLVDEGINLLTGEQTPAPVEFFAAWRAGDHPFFDFYDRILPVCDDGLKGNGAKTGGDLGAHLLGRVSPVGSRRFKPLALWKADVPLAAGRGRTRFSLPEFVGEVRVTAVVRSADATGAASIRRKVSPKLVTMPDAPRFVAPGDAFEATLPMHNRSGADGEVRAVVCGKAFEFPLEKDASTNLAVRLTAPAAPGQMSLAYRAEGFGEVHEQTIELPVRPAVAWRETVGVCRAADWTPPADGKWSSRTFDTPIGEYEAALKWLADYPHGCLEQTCSRVFPLIAAGGVLNAVAPNGVDCAQAGVRRVESMIRENDFTTWPDCSCAPWNRDVSLYAAHFLVAAGKAGLARNPAAERRVQKFLDKWSDDRDPEIAAYAALTLTLAGKPPKSRMLTLFDQRGTLSALARARLALAFAETPDLPRAKTLLAGALNPQSVKETAFALMALLAVDPDDARILPLVQWLNERRDRAKCCWGTTEENAHALVALGAHYRAHPPKKGEKFVAWRVLSLPKPEETRDDQQGLFVTRRYCTPEGADADLGHLKCGELLLCTLSITSDVTRVVSDLVVEDLFPGGFEPVRRELDPATTCCTGAVPRVSAADWVMRKDARDDRMLVFSKQFTLEAGREAFVAYPVRVVSAGDFVLPGTSVEGMYDPALHARRAPGRVVVGH